MYRGTVDLAVFVLFTDIAKLGPSGGPVLVPVPLAAVVLEHVLVMSFEKILQDIPFDCCQDTYFQGLQVSLGVAAPDETG